MADENNKDLALGKRKLMGHLQLGVPVLVSISLAIIFNLDPTVNRFMICALIALIINLVLYGIYMSTQKVSYKTIFAERVDYSIVLVGVFRFAVSIFFAYSIFSFLLFVSKGLFIIKG